MKKIFCLLPLLVLCSAPVRSQGIGTLGDTVRTRGLYALDYLPPADEKPYIIELGLGLGLPYGTIGGKISAGNSFLTGNVGFGILPFAWDLSTSFGATLSLLDRYSPVRIKVSGLWSNTVAAIIFINQSYGQSTLSGDLLYKEEFPGFALYGGIDVRLGKTSPYFVEFQVGGIFPTVGLDEVKKRYDEKRDEMAVRGYVFQKEYISLRSFPFISVGINYVIGRSLELR